MAEAGVKIKIMPTSPETNLEEIESKAKKVVEGKEGKVASSEIEPVAFGLKALIILVVINETFEQDPLLDEIRTIENVSSAEIIDFRRIGF